MPFVYYGGKKGSAHRYPPPALSTIIEPFAGSAGYALAWATPSTRVILVERDPEVVDIWRRLQAPDVGMRERMISALPIIVDWTVIEGDFTEAPGMRASWFIDPPYAPRRDGREPGVYHAGADALDYPALAEWCRARSGQVIVCEQEGADWLPFRPLFVQHSAQTGGYGNHPPRVEMIWSRTPGIVQPGTRRTAAAHEARKVRRRDRKTG